MLQEGSLEGEDLMAQVKSPVSSRIATCPQVCGVRSLCNAYMVDQLMLEADTDESDQEVQCRHRHRVGAQGKQAPAR
jgi:hypothetical protein